jgi:histidinol-phosphate aminotransferase
MPLPDDILRPHLSTVTYTPVKPLDVLALEIGIPEGQLIKLDANENLYGPLPSVRAAVDGVDMHIYPDPSQHRLKHALSQLHGCSSDSLVVGAGSDEVALLPAPLLFALPPPHSYPYRF